MHQHFQHAQFACGELERHTVEGGAPARGVDVERSMRKHRATAGLAAADQRAHAGFEFRQVEGLGQIIVSTEIESLDSVIERIARGQHEHRDLRPAAAQPAQHFEPVELGQPEIEYHQIIALGEQHVVRLVAGADAVYSVICLAQRAR